MEVIEKGQAQPGGFKHTHILRTFSVKCVMCKQPETFAGSESLLTQSHSLIIINTIYYYALHRFSRFR